MAVNNDLIPVKSPLAILGACIQLIRDRFDAIYGMPWKYYPGDAGRATSTIHIEAGKNPGTENYGKMAAIYVNRGDIRITQPVINDSAIKQVGHSVEFFNAIGNTSITYSCESRLPAEAETIGDIVLSTVLMGSNQIERTFDFRKIGPFSVSTTNETRHDTEITQVNVNMGLSYDIRWVTRDIGPKLRELVVKVKDSTYTNNDDYFVEIYKQSLLDSE